MTKLFLDIETNTTDRADVVDYIAGQCADDLVNALAEVKAPGNYKDEAKIAEFIANKRAELQSDHEKTIAAKVAKTGLDGAFGRVCVIGWTFDDGEVQEFHNAVDEAALLQAFNSQLPIGKLFECTVVGHNVSAFDLRFLAQRYIVNKIKPPLIIRRAAEAKPWEADKVFDTMVQWAGVGQKIKLDKLCLALGIPSPKGEIDGSKVAEFVAAGRIEEVAAYCKRDVEATRAIYKRMTFAE